MRLISIYIREEIGIKKKELGVKWATLIENGIKYIENARPTLDMSMELEKIRQKQAKTAELLQKYVNAYHDVCLRYGHNAEVE